MPRRETTPSTDTPIWLCDALKRYIDYYQSRDLAWQELVRVLAVAPRRAWNAEFKGHRVPDLWKRLCGKGGRQFAVAPHPKENFIAAHDAQGPYTAFRIQVARDYVLARLPARVPTKPRKRHQIDRVIPALRKLYPPNGKIPADMYVETARAKVAAHLEPESQAKGLADPSWKTVKAAIEMLGRING